MFGRNPFDRSWTLHWSTQWIKMMFRKIGLQQKFIQHNFNQNEIKNLHLKKTHTQFDLTIDVSIHDRVDKFWQNR